MIGTEAFSRRKKQWNELCIYRENIEKDRVSIDVISSFNYMVGRLKVEILWHSLTQRLEKKTFDHFYLQLKSTYLTYLQQCKSTIQIYDAHQPIISKRTKQTMRNNNMLLW